MITLCSINDRAHHKGTIYCTTVGVMSAQFPRIECLIPYWGASGWAIVSGHQNGTVSDAEYTRIYKYILGNKQNWPHVKAWLDGLDPNRDETYCCFCPEFKGGKPKFCHRQLIAQMLAKHRPDIPIVLH